MVDQSTTQSFVPVKEIRDGVIIRDDGVLCAIVLVTTLNFSLKSEDERNAILYQFQSLLNSLEVSIQILIQSRRLNMRPYLEFLKDIEKKQDIELLKLQTREYINFIDRFTSLNEIMSKSFFVVVSYSPIKTGGGGFKLFKKGSSKVKEKAFEENKTQLIQRVGFVQNNIRSLGLRTVRLGTEAVTELLYQTFNPGDTQTPPSV